MQARDLEESPFSLNFFGAALQAQCDSLKSLDIGYTRSTPGYINIANLLALESWKVSYYNIKYSPEIGISKMLGLKLHTLILEAHPTYGYESGFDNLDQKAGR